jgi:hypothetical protein
MADLRHLATASDDALADAVRGLGGLLDVPAVAMDRPDPAARARSRIEAVDRSPTVRPFGLSVVRPVRRAALLALAAVLVLVALAGAFGLGLPGLKIVPASPPGSPAPSAGSASPALSPSPTASPTSSSSLTGPPGSALELGRPVTLDVARATAPFPVLLPGDPSLGPPDAVWIDDLDRLSLVWAPRANLPPTIDPTVGLVVSEMPGHIERGYFEKLLDAGSTIEPVTIAGVTGYWIAGEPHEFVYVAPDGEATFDDRRLAGDTAAWSTGDVTYRVESALGREATIRLADTLR